MLVLDEVRTENERQISASSAKCPMPGGTTQVTFEALDFITQLAAWLLGKG